MNSKIERKITLSIDTAVKGWSISIIECGNEIDFETGESKVSKAEEVLEKIENLFRKNQIKNEAIERVIVSEGPGSVTGIKIGFALAKGLARAFNCPLYSLSALVALLSKATHSKEGRIITAVPVGENLVAWQSFEKDSFAVFKSLHKSQISDIAFFFTEINSGNCAEAILHNSTFSLVSAAQIQIDKISLIDAGMNLALLAGNMVNNKIKHASDNE